MKSEYKVFAGYAHEVNRKVDSWIESAESNGWVVKNITTQGSTNEDGEIIICACVWLQEKGE